jgi:hypothetical protein
MAQNKDLKCRNFSPPPLGGGKGLQRGKQAVKTFSIACLGVGLVNASFSQEFRYRAELAAYVRIGPGRESGNA